MSFLRIQYFMVMALMATTLSAFAGTVTANFTSASTIPVTAASYTATGNDVNLSLGFAPPTGTNLTVVENTELAFISGEFSNLAHGQVVNLSYSGKSYRFVTNYYGGSGNDLVLEWAYRDLAAWGSNTSGQLGNNSITSSSVPVPVTQSGVLSGKTVLAVSAGDSHSLVLCSDGTIAAWGQNGSGQLGNNSTTSTTSPVLVTQNGVLSGKTVVAVSAGGSGSLALCTDGTIAAWGSNTGGQLGNGSNTDSSVPVLVTRSGVLSGKTVVAVSAGDYHSLALCSDGTIAAWGDNYSGQLGNYGDPTSSSVPVLVRQSGLIGGQTAVLSGKKVVAVSAGGRHSLALCSDGTIAAWGWNSSGQLGNVTSSISGGISGISYPVLVTQSGVLSGKTVLAVSAGGYHSLALCSDGTIAAWGSNGYGTLGNNSIYGSSVPVLVLQTGVLSGKTVVGVSAGDDHSLALCSDGALAAWGNGGDGRLGNGNGSNGSRIPVLVTQSGVISSKTVVAVSAGSSHSLALSSYDESTASLSNLSLSSGNITPQFDPTTTGYNLNVLHAVSSITVLPTALIENLTVIKVNGSVVASGNNSQSIPLVVGANVITILVTAPDGITTKTYTVTVTRAPSTVSTLSALTLSSGTLSPGFESSTTSYTASVTNATTSITVRPTLTTTLAMVRVNGTLVTSGSDSQSIPLTVGKNTITVVGTAQDGTTTSTYTITVTRGLSLVASLVSPSSIPFTAASFTATGNDVQLSLGFAPPTGTNLTVVKNTGLPFISGEFSNLAHGQVVNLSYDGKSYRFVANYYGGSGNDLVLEWAYRDLAAWGNNEYGQLGNNNTNSRVPALVNQGGVLVGKTVVAVSARGYHSLALCSDGTMAAWGLNDYGQLGNNSIISSSVPVLVTRSGVLSGKTVVAVSAGTFHSLALCSDGTMAAWGYNSYGQLGNNSTTSSSVPVLVTQSGVLSGKTVVAVSAGTTHSLALCSDGTMAAWGLNGYGELGNNSATSSSVPVLVTQSGVLSGKTVVAVSAGGSHSLALCSDGTTAAWGANDSGQLGNNSTTSSSVPVLVTQSGVLSGKTVVAVSAGTKHSLALCSDGTIAAWGANVFGELGVSPGSSVPGLVNQSGVLAGKTVVAVSASNYNSLALCSDGTMAEWGLNDYGQLGIENRSSYPVLVTQSWVLSGKTVVACAAGGRHSLALCSDGTIAAWGSNEYGQLGKDADTVLVAQSGVLSGKTVLAVSAGGYHSLALCSDGTIAAWGQNGSGQLGNNSTTSSSVPVLVTQSGVLSGKTVVAVSAGNSHSLALCSDGTIAAWGWNGNGTLGNNSTTSSSVPVLVNQSGVLSGKTVVAVSASGGYSLALCSDGTMAAWGNNWYGQLGNGSTTDSKIPVLVNQTGVLSGKTVVAVSASGDYHSLALCSDGTIAAWGYNYFGQLGNNSTTNSSAPVLVTQGGVLSGKTVVAVSAGGYHSLALCSDGTIAAWGYNSYGQLGNNSVTISSVPVLVIQSGVLSGKTVVAVTAGDYHSLALCLDGTMAAWGQNTSGELGNSSKPNITVPVLVTQSGVLSGKTVLAVSVGGRHSLALTSYDESVAYLSNLSLSSGNINPQFDPTTTVYSVNVLNVVSSLTVLPTALVDGMSVLKVNGSVVASGSTSQSIPLEVGDNDITVLVTSPDGMTTKTYTVTVMRAASTVSTLSALTLSSGNLSPGFASSTTSYTASVTNATTSITVRPNLTATTATVRVNGFLVTSGSDSQNIPLTVGNNTITVVGTAQDGTTTTYTVTVMRISNVSTLSSLILSSGTLSPGFASNTTSYTAIVADTTSITIEPTATNSFASVRVNGSLVTTGSASQSIPLALGGNTITVMGAAQDGTSTSTYTLTVTRLRLTDSTLSALTLSSGTLSPVFASSTTSYTTSVSNTTSAITVRPTLSTTTASVRVNGALVTSGSNSQSIPLTVGSNSITILGTAEDGTTTTSYTVTVTRAPSAVSTLSALTLSSGTLSPVFVSGTTNYTASVTNATTSVTVRPTVTDATATIKVNGTTVASDSDSAALPLEVGPNTITVVGTAQDGTSTSTYTLVVKRKSAISSLSGLVLSSGTLSPAFASPTTSYTTSIAQGVGSLTVTPTVTDSNASVKVNGVTVASGSASGQIPLGLEATTVTSVVTAEDPAFTTSYTVTVGERVLSSPAALVVTSSSYTATGNAANIRLGFAPATGTSLMLVNNTGIGFISGEFQNLRHGQELVLPFEGKDYRYVVDYYGGTGNDLVLQWADNGLIGWGKNAEGQLGIGSLADQSVPTDLVASGLLSGKKVAAVAVGEFHTLALSDDGILTAWGLNASGQLGTNNTANSQLPVAVVRPDFLNGKQIVAVAAGNHFSLALCSDGTLASWGDNSLGQLGDGSAKVNSIEPLDITGKGVLAGRTVVAIRAGARHALALCSDGRVVAWGANESGQHGNGTTQDSNLPVLVNANGALLGKTVQSISAGGKHSLALFTDGGIAAWGANQSGQLGNNSTVSSNVPVSVPSQGAISGKTVIGLSAGGDHSLAVCSDGTVAAWGLNSSGQLGNFSNNTSFVPVPVTMNTGALLSKRVIAVSASAAHSVALCSDETTVAWGANASGSLGNNSNTSSNIPVAVTRSGILSSKKVSAVATGGAQSFALCSDGTLTSWGLNTSGQLGNNTTETTRVPVAVTTTTGALFGKTVVATSVGQAHTVVRFSNGGMAAWGRNAEGQLGNDTTANSNIPVEVFNGGVLSGKKVASVSAGAAHNIALCSDGTVVTWGSNSSGQLGTGTAIVSSIRPINITGLGALSGKTVVAVAAGSNHSLALCSDGRVVAWGRGSSGQLGTGSTGSSSLPVAVSWTGVMAGKDVISIAAGADHNLALCSDGTLVAWGRNDFGQIGNNLSGNLSSPGRVETTSGALFSKTVISLAAGTNHSLVLCSDGTLAAWGSNAQGQLGSSGSNGSFVPIAVARSIGALFGKTVTKIGCGEFHSTALTGDGSLASWGEGVTGQLGNNTLISSDIPESVTTSGALSGKSVWSLASGGSSSFAIAALPASLLPRLSNLILSGVTLSPAFSSDITSYSASVINSVNSITIRPSTTDSSVSVKVNGTTVASGNTSAPIALQVGVNTISVEAFSLIDSTKRFYTITVTRELFTGPNLSNLSLSNGSLSPSFAANTTSYAASVANATSSITVTPTVTTNTSTVRVNGTLVTSGSASQSIPLEVGSNTITVIATAQDGTTASTYTVTVTRAGVNLTLDTDGDGIPDWREVELGTNPTSGDSDGDGLSDTYELVFKGTTAAFKPRIGDRLRYELQALGFQGTYKLVGKLPTGLTFNATTGVIEGKLTGKPGTSALTVQILNGSTVVRSIPLNLPVGDFPATLTGDWQALLEDGNGLPQGLVTASLTSPGKWSGTLDLAGSSSVLRASGTFDLNPASESATLNLSFAGAIGSPSTSLSLTVNGPDAQATGSHAQETLRGFRLARGTELPSTAKTFTLVIDQGEQDGFLKPAGLGWATGSLSTKGVITLTGQLGDAQTLKGALKLGATGQALIWLKPYRNLSSRLGGVISFHETGVIRQTALSRTTSGLTWYRAADASELSYSSGFAALHAEVGVRGYSAPSSSASLAQGLGLTQQTFRNVVFAGGGLPDVNATAILPEAFALEASYKLVALPVSGKVASWTGQLNAKTGGFTGTLGVAASSSGILAGNAPVSGVLFPASGTSQTVAAGLVKIPISGPSGAYRTGAVLMSK